MLKDFNIAAEAGGVRKEVVKRFTAVVNGGTLEIRFYWAGKGTTGIPIRGVYGPLISAISVNPGKSYFLWVHSFVHASTRNYNRYQFCRENSVSSFSIKNIYNCNSFLFGKLFTFFIIYVMLKNRVGPSSTTFFRTTG